MESNYKVDFAVKTRCFSRLFFFLSLFLPIKMLSFFFTATEINPRNLDWKENKPRKICKKLGNGYQRSSQIREALYWTHPHQEICRTAGKSFYSCFLSYIFPQLNLHYPCFTRHCLFFLLNLTLFNFLLLLGIGGNWCIFMASQRRYLCNLSTFTALLIFCLFLVGEKCILVTLGNFSLFMQYGVVAEYGGW